MPSLKFSEMVCSSAADLFVLFVTSSLNIIMNVFLLGISIWYVSHGYTILSVLG